MSTQLRLTVAETIQSWFQSPAGQRRVATPTSEKSYGLEIYELQTQKRHQLSSRSRLTVVQTIRGQPPRKRVTDQVSQSQLQRMHHTRTRRLPIAASMRFDKLPSNWVNWRLQGRFQSPCVHKSRVTGNAKAGPSPKISPILIRQAQSRANYRDDAGHNCTPKCTHGGWGRV